MKLKFIGATDGVTGSMTLIESHSILIDSGFYQGDSEVHKKNFLELPFFPKQIKAIILTHAHLDHSGYIPRLVKMGFRGDIFATPATIKLAKIILSDSAHLQEEEEIPFYTVEDVNVMTSLFKPKEFHHSFSCAGVTATLIPAGHILGAASVLLKDDETVLFSGDLGRSQDVLLDPPPPCPSVDRVIMESTYGGKIRTGHMEQELYSFLIKISRENRIGIIASFAVARAQTLLTLIDQFFKRHPEEKIRVVMDSPMMKLSNKVYQDFSDQTKMSKELYSALDEIEVLESVGEWESLKKKSGPLLIISSSGMVTGGRIWRHLKNWQSDENAILFLPGYQAQGTAGFALSQGKKIITSPDGEKIRWEGEVLSSDAFSSHADQEELLDWVANLDKKTSIYLLHGENEAKHQLKEKLLTQGFEQVILPARNQSFASLK